jgi:hypothetical protein
MPVFRAFSLFDIVPGCRMLLRGVIFNSASSGLSKNRGGGAL